MTRLRHLTLALVLAAASPALADDYQPAPPDIPNYFAQVMPCKIVRAEHTDVSCKGNLLENKSLRELSILRNTIYARWGWDGYRKPWLKAYFHAQPWFKPNPKFSYKLLSDADRKNAHLIALREQGFTTAELETRREALLERHGGDRARLTPEEKIELGLIARAMGQFALDEDTREQSASASLDRLLTLGELRQLSLRDLRLLRNTIYARRGRTFKSEILRDHFTGLDWYKPVPSYSDKLLSANDTRNIALIRSVENELGGPLSDEDWLTEPATDGA